MFDIISSKQLPGERQAQAKTLLVISSSHEARVFMIENHNIDELATLSSKDFDQNLSDDNNERPRGFSFISNQDSSQGTNVGFKENKRMHDDPLFVREVTQALQDIDDKFESHKIIVYAPAGIDSLFTTSFTPQYSDKLVVHSGNYVNTTLPEIFELLQS